MEEKLSGACLRKRNEDLVDKGKLVIRRREHVNTIMYYRRSAKNNEGGYKGYGWAVYKRYDNVYSFELEWNNLIINGAVEG